MLVNIDQTTTQLVTIEIPSPYYCKHKTHEWFIMITEDFSVEVDPWRIGCDDKAEWATGYNSRLKRAVSSDYVAIEEKTFQEAYDKIAAKISSKACGHKIDTVCGLQ
jgi:hypothetical protein